MTIDRFFGADFFDRPKEPFLAELSQKYVIDYSPDFTEGLGDRLLITTCWQEELTQIVTRQLATLERPVTEETVLDLVTALKTLSGSYVLQLFENEGIAEAVNKTIAMGITLHHLLENNHFQNAFLVPLALHPELFGEEVQQLGDFLIVQFDKDHLLITCVDAIIMTGNTMPEELTSRLNKTEELLNTQYFASSEEQTIGTPLERARLIMLLRFYFAKGLRYGFLEEERVGKFNEILSKVEAGKIQPKMAKTGYLVCPTQAAERSEPVTLEGISVIRLGKGVWVAKPPSILANQRLVEEPVNNLDSVTTTHLPVEEIPPDESTFSSETLPQITTELPPYPSAPEIPLGKTVKGEETIFWKPSVQGSPHLLMVGIPGQGKSVTMNMLLSHLQQQGVGTLTLDFHGDFCDSKKSVFQHQCHPTVWNAAQGLPFSPFEFEADLYDEISQNSWKLQSSVLAEVFGYVCKLGILQKDDLLRAIKNCYEEVIRRNDNSLPTIPDLQRKLEFLEDRKKIQKGVLARCRPLLEMNVFKPDATPWDLLQTTKRGLVINLKDIGSETVRLATSAFVLRKVYQTVLTWDKSEVMKLAIVLDEAHRLAKDQTLPTIMKEARKFGVAVIIASQNLNDFHEHVVGTVGTRIMFRSNDPESKKVSKMVPVSGKTDAKTLIENLKTGEALVKTEKMEVAKKVKMDLIKL